MPELFRPDRAGSTTATTHWSITGRPDGGADEWTVRFADGDVHARSPATTGTRRSPSP